jgi:2-amino-4-hydroxy-6-hydroxymethyldihydropteridine diphosphokinase
MAVAVGLRNDLVRGHVDENPARQSQHDGKSGGRGRGKHISEQGAERDRQPARSHHEQTTPGRNPGKAKGRAHDHAFTDVLDADRDDQQPTQTRAVACSEASTDGKALGNAVDAERSDDGVAAPELVGRFVRIVAFEADVTVVSARVAVGDEAIHERCDHDSEQKPQHHFAEENAVEPTWTLHAFQSLGQQAQGRGGQHEACPQSQDAVVGATRQAANEEERECSQARGQAGQTSCSEGFQHARPVLTTLQALARISSKLDAMVVYLGLGSNLGDRRAEMARAIQALARLGHLSTRSALYETEPEGGADQPMYLNAAVRLETELSARALLHACLDIERAQGRVRPTGVAKAARTIDIDLLLYGAAIIEEPGLHIPHPALLSRPFVRIPLAEVASPDLRHPLSGESLAECTPDPTVRRLLSS